MNEQMKIAILGAGEGQMALIHRAINAGWYVIVVSPKGDYPGFKLADKCCYADISDAETVLQIVKKEGANAIATDQTDISVPVVQFVCEQLRLPHITCKEIKNFQLKSNMRVACEREGIPTIPYRVVSSLEEAEEFLLSIAPHAAIIKPIDSQGSRGVQRVADIVELRRDWDEAIRYSKSKRVIIERFVVGQEIEVDTVMRDGNILGVLIGDVFNFELKDTFSGYERIYPTHFDNELQNKIREINAATLKALGMITGWTHGEYIVTETGEVFLIEVGARGGGNYIGSDIVRIMLGVGTDEMAFRNAIGDESFYDEICLRDTYCAYKCFYLPEGILKSVQIDDTLFTEPYLLMHNLDSLREGMTTHSNKDKTSRYTVVLQADSREQLRERLDQIPSRISVQVETDEGIKECIWK